MSIVAHSPGAKVVVGASAATDVATAAAMRDLPLRRAHTRPPALLFAIPPRTRI